ncbi:MAG: hypothetical protein LBV07_05145 [Syntrophobacterales bacterium]|jgi:predicted ABC-type ATPase|nr:hypothetical protein [Syntrophobacterales bacterium]
MAELSCRAPRPHQSLDRNSGRGRINQGTTRVRQGGHDIPEAGIRRRFTAGMENFQHHYRILVDDWTLYDNMGDVPVLLEWGEKQ